MAPMFPLVVDRPRRRGPAGEAADRVPRLHRGGCPRPNRRAGHRGAAPRRRRCVAGQLGQRGRAGRAGPRVCGMTGSCRSRTTSTTVNPQAPHRFWCPADPVWPDQAAGSWPGSNRLRASGRPHRPHRIDRCSRVGRQGCDRHPGDGRLAGGRRRTGRRVDLRGIRAQADHRRRRQAQRPQHGRGFDHTNDESLWHKRFHCFGRSWPTDQRAHPGRRLAGSAVRAAVRRLADGQSRCAGRLPGAQAAGRGRGARRPGAYADAKEPWFLDAYRRAWEWADTTGWRP